MHFIKVFQHNLFISLFSTIVRQKLTTQKNQKLEKITPLSCLPNKKACPPCKSNSGWQAGLAKKFPSPLRCAACPTAGGDRLRQTVFSCKSSESTSSARQAQLWLMVTGFPGGLVGYESYWLQLCHQGRDNTDVAMSST